MYFMKRLHKILKSDGLNPLIARVGAAIALLGSSVSCSHRCAILSPERIVAPITVYSGIAKEGARCCTLSEPVGVANGGDNVEVLDEIDPKDPMYFKIRTSSGIEGWIDPQGYPFADRPRACE
jgi:hypothetical protein